MADHRALPTKPIVWWWRILVLVLAGLIIISGLLLCGSIQPRPTGRL